MPPEVPNNASPLTIALIGATKIAELIAERCLRAKQRVIIDDISDARLQATSRHLRAIVGAQHRCAPGPQDQSDSAISGLSSSSLSTNLALTQSIESAIRSADLIIDTLPDDLEVKLELFTLFDKFAKPAAIFITTGTIPIDDLAEITFSPERCVAVHLAPLDHNQYAFELLPGARTSAETIAACSDFFGGTCGFSANHVP